VLFYLLSHFFLQGAGDAFIGALAFYISKKGFQIRDAVDFACQVAAISVQLPGTQKSFPKYQDLPSQLKWNTHLPSFFGIITYYIYGFMIVLLVSVVGTQVGGILLPPIIIGIGRHEPSKKYYVTKNARFFFCQIRLP